MTTRFADRFAALHAAYRHAEERLQMVEETMSSDASGGARLPWEEIRDWFHEAGNYIDLLDRRAEQLADQIGPGEPALIGRLRTVHGVGLDSGADAIEAPLRALDRRTRRLSLSPALPPESRRFFLAHQLAAAHAILMILDRGAGRHAVPGPAQPAETASPAAQWIGPAPASPRDGTPGGR